MKMTRLQGLAAAGLGFLTMVAGARGQQAAQPVQVVQRPAGNAAQREPGDLPGPIDSLSDIQDTAKMLFKLADTNNDNLISQKEAVDVGNLLVGGFFFRADANGDGTISQEEARAARESLLRQKPMLRLLVERLRQAPAAHGNDAEGNAGGKATNANPLRAIADLLDSNNDKQLQATEVRKAVQNGVTSLYQVADTNRDGELSPAELNAAVIGAARAAAQAAFQAADADHNGAISQAEFDKAIMGPAHIAFQIVDANNDGQITPQEAQTAERIIMSQLRMLAVPEPANSPANLIRSTRTGAQPAGAATTTTAPR
ncbi:MAG TPA: EF-hand domain-containing protein [Isosphaeraceae bacterium]|jgi:Ca2+-binding EF-hand superfamily protein|nr:EF-hand domain-containing protein [Isosphaeraceae bacterium]